jgi:hypothetical protein
VNFVRRRSTPDTQVPDHETGNRKCSAYFTFVFFFVQRDTQQRTSIAFNSYDGVHVALETYVILLFVYLFFHVPLAFLSFAFLWHFPAVMQRRIIHTHTSEDNKCCKKRHRKRQKEK